jgi:lipid A ethanolaminephosphotransferase
VKNKPLSTPHPHRIAIASSLWIALVCNIPLWKALFALPNSTHTSGLWFAAVFGLVLFAGNTALFALFAWRWTTKPVAAILVLTAAVGAYFMQAYGIQIDASMITNTLQTDVRETGDLVNLKMLLMVSAMALPAWWWIYRQPIQHPSPWRLAMHNTLMVVACICIIVAGILATFQTFSSTMRNHTQLRYMINPLNTVYGLLNVATNPLRMHSTVLMPLGRDAKLGTSYAGQEKPPLVILVLGETARSVNFGINGYTRNTTPQLGARTDLISAHNAWSCGTSTATSVPCMFSHWGKSDFEGRKTESEGLLDVLRHAGLAVLWVDNQSGCKGVCDHVAHVDSHRDNPACADSECLDISMLAQLDRHLASLPAEQKAKGTVIVLHQMGSHGPAYFKRSAPERKLFTPECQSTSLQNCPKEAVVNAYDNSIVETDYFLNALIQWASQRQHEATTAMMYVSDHGESLGENNLYLHGLPYSFAPDVQKHVPWLLWLSPDMQQRLSTSTPCLQQALRNQHITHDAYFHSVLGMLDVDTSAYQASLDILQSCRGITPR